MGEINNSIDQPMVSVPLLVYNQRDYIRQCLDSVISQKTNFRIEVLVGDDCSTDGTREIIREYAEKYPDRIIPVLREKNLGITKNLYDLLKRCKGRYIAGLEGDDYWLDDNKLQIQYEFLEAHKEYIGCSHPVRMIDEHDQEVPFGKKYIEGCHWGYYQSTFSFEQYRNFEMPGQGSTWFYRNIYLEPKYDYSVIEKASPIIGDRTVMMLVSAQGDWYYMQDKVMTCYRYVTSPDKSSWASWSRNSNRSLQNIEFNAALDNYARSVLGRKVDFREQNYLSFREAADWFFRERDPASKKKNRKIIQDSLRILKPKYYYLFRLLWFYIQKRIFVSTVKYAIEKDELKTEDPRLAESSWRSFSRKCQNRTLVLFGGGLAYREFMERYGGRFDVTCLLDNSLKNIGLVRYVYIKKRDYWHDKGRFAFVMHPDVVKDWDRDRFVVLITSSLYQDQMAKQLKEMDFFDYYSFGIMESKKLRYRLISKLVKK